MHLLNMAPRLLCHVQVCSDSHARHATSIWSSYVTEVHSSTTLKRRLHRYTVPTCGVSVVYAIHQNTDVQRAILYSEYCNTAYTGYGPLVQCETW